MRTSTYQFFIQPFTALVGVFVCVMLLVPAFAEAQFNQEINYQGKLTTAAGVAVPDGLYNMNFWLVPTDVGATSTAVWSETRTSGNRIQVTNGLFSVMLGEVSTLSAVDFNQTLYLGVEIGGIATTTPTWDGEMSPRKVLGAVPAAFVANYATTAGSASSSLTLDGVASSSFLRSDESDTMTASSSSSLLSLVQNGVGKILSLFSGVTEIFTVLSNGNVGVGTSVPSSNLDVTHNAIGAALSDTSGLSLVNTTSATAGVQQVSPALRFSSNGWKTTATAASQETEWSMYNLPVVGTTAPSSNLILASSINGGAYTSRFTLTSAGALSSITSVTMGGALSGATTGAFSGAITNTQTLTTVPTNGLLLTTTASALVGTPVRISPSVVWSGTAWNTTPTAASKINAIESYLLPSSGASTGGSLVFANRTVNGIANSTELMRLTTAGNVGIGTTTPGSKLTVAGNTYIEGDLTATGITSLANASTTNLSISGNLYDGANSAGTQGMVLQTTSTSTQWVATSSLGIASGATTFLGLTDTISSYNANRVLYTSGSAVTDNANFTYDGTNLGLGGSNGIAFGGTRFITASTTSGSITFGENAGATFNSGTSFNTAIGFEAGRYASATASYNNYIGYQAGYNNTGTDNNIFGDNAGYNNIGWSNNILGSYAGNDNTGINNNLLGNGAGYSNTGDYNNILGEYAGSSNTGDLNNIFGRNAGNNNAGSDNNIFGRNAGNNNTGNLNNIFGWDAGNGNTGSDNNFFGQSAGYSNTGDYNEMFGSETGYYIQSTSSVLIGSGAFRGTAIFQAINNTAIGYQAGYNASTSADNNILLGYRAADNLTTGNNNIVIGYDIDLITATTDNTLNIGNLIFGTGLDGTGTTLASGNVGIGTTTPGSKLTVAGNTYIGGNLTATGITSLANASTTNLSIAGNLYDGANSAGTQGMVLQTTGTSTQWVATSTLGISGGASTFLGLTDTISSYNANRVLYTSGSAVIDNANFTYDGINLGLGGTNGIAFGGTRYITASTTNDSITFGENAGATFNSGTTYNVALGFEAGRYASTSAADNNNYIGYQAGYSNTGLSNNFMGSYAGLSNTGTHSNFFGAYAGANNTGINNNLLGPNSGYSNTGANNNIFGSYAGYSNTGANNNIFGPNSGYSNTGANNNILGSQSGRNNTGLDNNLFGQSAGYYNTGTGNNLFGSSTGYYNTGINNNMFGYNAGRNNSGSNNNFLGSNSGSVNTGSYNEMFGFETGRYIQSTSSVLIGSGAFRGTAAFQAINNTAIGYQAGYNASTSADNNILLGYRAADNLTTGNNNIVIGYDIDLTTDTTDNTLNIGNLIFGTGLDGTGTTLASGNVGIGTTTPDAKLSIVDSTSSSGDYFSVSRGIAGANGRLAINISSTTVAINTSVKPLIVGTTDGQALKLQTNNTDRLTITSGGLIGIGTTSPTSLLTLDNGAGGVSNFAGSSFSMVGVNASTPYMSVTSSGSADLLRLIGSGSNPALYVLNSGNVGIGTSTPLSQFHVEGSSAGIRLSRTGGQEPFIYLYDGNPTNNYGGQIRGIVTSGGLRFTDSTNVSEWMRISSSGNIGIGTTTPVSKLTVAGGTYIGGNLSVTGAFRDSTNASGTQGMVLQTTGTSTQWVATSSLGIASGATTFLGLTDTISSYNANRVLYTSGSAVIDNANFTYDGINLGLGGTNGIAFGGTRYITASTTNDSITFGENAGATFNSGTTYNVALGFEAGRYASTSAADNNNYIGYFAGRSNTGSYNNLFGQIAGSNNTGSNNNLFGQSAGQSNTGSNNNLFGQSAGQSNTGSNNNSFGLQAGRNSTGSDNNFLGQVAGYNNTGSYNNFMGSGAGELSGTGSYNNLFGLQAGRNSTGSNNNIFGLGAGYSTTGSDNNIFGQSAGFSNTGSYNNIFGQSAGFSNTGSYNEMFGFETGRYIRSTSSVLIGSGAFRGTAIFQAINNTAIGYQAGYNASTSADNNILLGYRAADNLTTGNNNIVIGYDIDLITATTDNTLNIGNLIFGTGLDGTGTTLASGNVGIGTTTPGSKLTVAGNVSANGLLLGTTTSSARLGMEKLNFATANTAAGIDQYFSFNNSVSGAVLYGNRSYLYATNTATTTIIGSIVRVSDSTTYGNTVRGLEVQADNGNNTKGENTGIAAFGRTFGVRGTTVGDAGGTFEPAGIYGETEGTTQGNAIRGYSSSITTAALLKLFQDTSAFTGTGLLMNFGNAGGTFSSTTASRFIDFQNAGVSMFTVGAYGMTTIGDGTTNHNAGLQIGYGGLCVDNDGSCTASTTGRISAVSYHTGNSDLAETYFSDESLKTGDVVYLKGGLSVGKASESTKDKVLGVVSTKPGLLLGSDDTSLDDEEVAYPIGLAGRVPVLLSNENGEIKAGDELMLSSLPGVAMKATSTGTVIGLALEDFDDDRAYSDTFINQFGDDLVEPTFTPINRTDDPRINDGCYYGAGSASGDTPCVPLTATTSDGQIEEADALARAEAEQRALAALKTVTSEEKTLANGTEVQVGRIVMFIKLEENRLGADGEAMVAALLAHASSTDAEVDADDTVWSRLVTLANNFIDGVLSVLTLKADRIEVKEELCVDGVCLNADDLRQLLDETAAETPAEEDSTSEPEEVPETEEAPADTEGGDTELPAEDIDNEGDTEAGAGEDLPPAAEGEQEGEGTSEGEAEIPVEPVVEDVEEGSGDETQVQTEGEGETVSEVPEETPEADPVVEEPATTPAEVPAP